MTQAAAWYQPVVNVASTVGTAIWTGGAFVASHIADGAMAIASFAQKWFGAGVSFAAEHKEHVVVAVVALAIGAVVTALFFYCCGSNPARGDAQPPAAPAPGYGPARA